MKVIVVFKRLLASGKHQHGRHLFKWGVTAGIFLVSILLKEMRYLVYIRYLCERPSGRNRTFMKLKTPTKYQL